MILQVYLGQGVFFGVTEDFRRHWHWPMLESIADTVFSLNFFYIISFDKTKYEIVEGWNIYKVCLQG